MKELLLFWFLCGVSIASGGYIMVKPCDQPKFNRGPCDGKFPRWSYDTPKNQCILFSYSGCMGNQNRFRTRKECKETCAKGPKHSMLWPPPGYLER